MVGRDSLRPVGLANIQIEDGFWAPRQRVNREVTLPIEYRQCKETGRIDAWHLKWRPGMPDPPHHFWDSDVAKWIEAVAYTVATARDPKLEGLVDEVIELRHRGMMAI